MQPLPSLGVFQKLFSFQLMSHGSDPHSPPAHPAAGLGLSGLGHWVLLCPDLLNYTGFV